MFLINVLRLEKKTFSERHGVQEAHRTIKRFFYLNPLR